MRGYDQKKLQEYMERRRKQNRKQRPARLRGAAAYTRALLMPDIIRDFVAKTRLELFGSPEPPFSDLDEMGNWLLDEQNSQPPPEGHAPRFGYKLERGTTPEKIKEMNAVRPGLYGLEFASLPYPTRDGWSSNVVVSDGTRLRRLWLAVRYIASELDCQQAQATALILAGTLPIVSAISASTPHTIRAGQHSRGKIEITIREPIPERELVRVYKKLKQALWGDVNRRPANQRDCKLVEFVHENLDPDNPQWENLMHEWNRQFPDMAFYGDSGYRGFRKAYKDAKQKIYPDIHWGDVTLTD